MKALAQFFIHKDIPVDVPRRLLGLNMEKLIGEIFIKDWIIEKVKYFR